MSSMTRQPAVSRRPPTGYVADDCVNVSNLCVERNVAVGSKEEATVSFIPGRSGSTPHRSCKRTPHRSLCATSTSRIEAADR
jgi:hypothetical protein